jgi:uncharacterized protein (TIGR02452 family)
MGRTEKSQGLAPPAIRKDIRAKQARHIINKVVPATLASNARARRGADNSELIVDPAPVQVSGNAKSSEKPEGGESEDVAYVKRKGQGRRKAKGGDADEENTGASRAKVKKSGKRRNDSIDEDMSAITLDTKAGVPISPKKERTVKIVTTDTLTVVQLLSQHPNKPTKKAPNVCILNMASPLRPGGGVLAGATSQEEFLCARTTLLPSLKEEFYRLPEYGGIFTPDVLVFRSPAALGDSSGDLGPSERYYVDVISAGMLRFPDLEGEEDEIKRLGKKDRDVVERKMRAVLRIAEAKGTKKLVLGAWGCGAYGNPVADVAQAWRRVLDGAPAAGSKKGKSTGKEETWSNLEDVVFAIPNTRMAKDFAKAFGSDVQVEDGPSGLNENEEEEEEDEVAQELQARIDEMEGQISKVWNPDLKSRLGVVLDGLKAQLKERQNKDGDSDQDDVDSGEDDIGSDNGDELGDEDRDDFEVDDDELDAETDNVDSGVAVKSQV